ncbi:hypothetical protein BCEP4_480040 [Burkholderia cepacia]|nr:hypothetical protein BCEP4_480040 [Burkholderia cepacia]
MRKRVGAVAQGVPSRLPRGAQASNGYVFHVKFPGKRIFCTGVTMCCRRAGSVAGAGSAPRIRRLSTEKSPKCTDPTIRTAFG